MDYRFPERGTSVFYLLIIAPFIFSLTVLTVDLSRYYGCVESLYDDAERIAYRLSQELPDTESVAEVFNQLLSQKSTSKLRGNIFYPDNTHAELTVTLEGSYSPIFGNLFANLLATSIELPYRARVSTSPISINSVIIISDDDKLRPRARLSDYGEPNDYENWGSQLDWPIAPTLSTFERHSTRSGTVPHWISDWNHDSLRWATQACFNPIWSQFKLAAISLVNALLRSGRNRVRVLYLPGDGDNGAKQLSYLTTTQSTDGITDALCALLSAPDAVRHNPYDLNLTGLSNLPTSTTPCKILTTALNFNGRSPQDITSFSSLCSTGAPTLQQQIYWHKAQYDSRTEITANEIISILNMAAAELGTVEVERDNLNQQNTRSKLRITVLLDSLPADILKVESTLLHLSESGVTVTFIAVAHEQLSPIESDQLEARSHALAEVAQRVGSQTTASKPTVMYTRDLEALRTSIIPAQASITQEVLLREIEVW